MPDFQRAVWQSQPCSARPSTCAAPFPVEGGGFYYVGEIPSIVAVFDAWLAADAGTKQPRLLHRRRCGWRTLPPTPPTGLRGMLKTVSISRRQQDHLYHHVTDPSATSSSRKWLARHDHQRECADLRLPSLVAVAAEEIGQIVVKVGL
ncbi:MAG: hypothetical protein U0528_04430 [Anaerolineae bacterium]